MRNTKFTRGSGAYKCVDCGKLTRDTGIGEADSKMCAKCYEIAMLENSFSDGDITEAEYKAAIAEIKNRYNQKGD